MKYIIILAFLLSLPFAVRAQHDSIAVKQLIAKARTFYFNTPDSCLFYAQKALALSKQIGFIHGETESLNISGEAYRFNGNYPGSLEMQFEALSLFRQAKNKIGEMNTLTFIGFTYVQLMEYQQGLIYLLKGKNILDEKYEPGIGNFLLSNIGHAYEKLNMYDSALHYQQLAYQAPGINYVPPLKTLILARLGMVHSRMENYDSAFHYYHQSLETSKGHIGGNPTPVQNSLAALHYTLSNSDSALYYAKKAYEPENTFQQLPAVLEASEMLSKLYREKGLYDSALFYSEVAAGMRDSLYGPRKFRQIQLFALKQQQEQQEIIQNELSYKSWVRTVALFSSLGVFIIIILLLIRNNRQKQKAKVKIEQSYDNLKATQQQLIQSEKMASLGELTAGIAHEIQNPLNFVNNFAEVNSEMISEMKVELDNGNYDEAKGIANTIDENDQKILFHGKRADAIVKGMLQHSRSSSGVKEPTDINALADEYLRLAYHGLRAKDKSFNVQFETDFDPSLPKLNVIPQDIGRVLLNLINNAFYACNEKAKQSAVLSPQSTSRPKADQPLAGITHELEASSQKPEAYLSKVTVATKHLGDKIEIRVKDNGSGISQNILDKIFQPFFTTKPTGQGTGLGLSLSYDIVKAHGGEITAHSKEGEGTEFVISLPS